MGELYDHIEWKCRRGTLELDLIFKNFYQQSFATLPDHEKKLFNQLLDESDPQLSAWIFGAEIPLNQNFVRLIKKIKT